METGKCVSKVSAGVLIILLVAASLALTPHHLKEPRGVKVSLSDDAQGICRLEQPGGGVMYKKMNEYTIDVTSVRRILQQRTLSRGSEQCHPG